MRPNPTANMLALLLMALTGAASAQIITTYAGGDNIFAKPPPILGGKGGLS